MGAGAGVVMANDDEAGLTFSTGPVFATAGDAFGLVSCAQLVVAKSANARQATNRLFLLFTIKWVV